MTTKCNHCNKKIPEAKVQYSLKKRGNDPSRVGHKLYCDRECHRAHQRKKKVECAQCGELTRKRDDIWSGREVCSPCKGSNLFRDWSNDEILYLVNINPGAGFHHFVKSVWPREKSPSVRKYKLNDFLREIGEFEKVDYCEWLGSPKFMRTVRQDDVPKELQWAINGNRRSIVSSHKRSQHRKAGMEVKDHNFVKIPPEFKWGKLAPVAKKLLEN